MSIPKRPMNSMNDLIQALKLRIDEDGFLELDPEQTTCFLFVLYELMEQEKFMKDVIGVKFAIQDLCGVLPDRKDKAV